MSGNLHCSRALFGTNDSVLNEFVNEANERGNLFAEEMEGNRAVPIILVKSPTEIDRR